jgi:hypothetical protein
MNGVLSGEALSSTSKALPAPDWVTLNAFPAVLTLMDTGDVPVSSTLSVLRLIKLLSTSLWVRGEPFPALVTIVAITVTLCYVINASYRPSG